MLELTFMRHARSEANDNFHIVSGQSNHTPLTPRGLEQGTKLGHFLENQKIQFDEIFCSPAVRTKQTKDQVFKVLGMELEDITVYDERMLELDQGEFTGIPRNEVYTPDVIAEIEKDNWNFRPVGGESQRDVEERALAFLEEKVLSHDQEGIKKVIGFFGHGLWIKMMLRGILNFDPTHSRHIDIENTSLTKLQYTRKTNEWKIHYINHFPHLYASKKS